MTPLERMARARWARVRKTARGEVKPFDALPEIVRRNMMEDDRIALLALAEAALSTDIIGAGAAKIAGVRTQHGDGRHLWEASAAFPAMLRAIAEGK